MNNGFLRVAAASPKVRVADVDYNVDRIIEVFNHVVRKSPHLVVFPEMCVTGYTCGDLFHNDTLLDAAVDGLRAIAEATAQYLDTVVVVGAPLRICGTLYNCAIALSGGKPLCVVPKTYVPNYGEFYEKRWWQPAPNTEAFPVEVWPGVNAPFGTDIIIEVAGATVGIEICEDLWTPIPPSSHLALAGADVIANLSASDDLIGKYSYLRNLVCQQSARCLCGYVYASAGFGESSTDLVFDGKLFIAENGRLLAHNQRWMDTDQIRMADIDIEAIRHDRLHMGSFHDSAMRSGDFLKTYTLVKAFSTPVPSLEPHELMREIDPHPFVPASDDRLRERCEEIVNIQVAGLAQRLSATGCRSLVVGISGGLDSTLALLVAERTFRRLGLDVKGIVGVTMPGFGTTGRTHSNALALMEALGVTTREISIVKAVEQHFEDIGHDASVHDVTYENSQARERTQILMDIANQVGGMVLGTGDLSELALGWATYNGDHMSMYGVNAGVPKTLVRHLTSYFAMIAESDEIRRPLLDIIDTPISPELIPAAADGTIKQKTEDLVGPYELHDFFLYYVLRYGFSPKRIYLLARFAFNGTYDNATILKWLRTFFRRFFAQQFKRSCLPDGPKVGSVCLSPRGDWRMPSDASASLWLKEIDTLK